MNSGPTLRIGATGQDVRRLQRIFVMTKVLAPNNITGSFDATTEQAVKDFQQGAGLTVDGLWDRKHGRLFQPTPTRRH